MIMLRFIHAQSNSIIGAATIVGFFSFLSRVIGFIRDRVLAGLFGAGDTLDVYYAAFKIPDFVFSLIVIGALSASFVPIFTRQMLKHDDSAGWRFTNKTIHALGLTMVFVSVLVFLFSEPLSALISPGFDGWKQARVAAFMRVMVSAQVILTLSMIFGSALQGLKRFYLFALAPLLYNASILIGAFLFVPRFGSIGLAWGVVLGACLHLISQWFGCLRAGYRYQWEVKDTDGSLREMVRLTGPRMLGIALSQLLFLVLTVIATLLPAGSVTIFQFAYNIQFFPVGVIGVSYAVAAFPLFAESFEKNDHHSFREQFSSTIRQTLFFLIPLTVLFLILRAYLVRVVVGAGAFDWEATILTADTLAFFALTFLPQSWIFILARAFFALHDTVTPLTAAFVAGLVGILSAFLFGNTLGVVGLGMAYSIAMVVNALLLWIPLRQRIGTLNESEIIQSLMKLTVAGLACGVVAQILKSILSSFFSLNTFSGVLMQGLIVGGLSLCVYITIAWILKSDELKQLIDVLKRRTIKKQIPSESVALHE